VYCYCHNPFKARRNGCWYSWRVKCVRLIERDGDIILFLVGRTAVAFASVCTVVSCMKTVLFLLVRLLICSTKLNVCQLECGSILYKINKKRRFSLNWIHIFRMLYVWRSLVQYTWANNLSRLLCEPPALRSVFSRR
jgi:predicted nucleic acid-binding Zn ribbon protein